MSGFEVITLTFSFILGLGVAQILSAVSSSIRERKERRLHWMPFCVAAVSFLMHVQFWFALVQADQLFEQWTWPSYLVLLSLAVILFLSGGVVLPVGENTGSGDLLDDFEQRGSVSLLLLAGYAMAWIPALIWFIGPEAAETALFNLIWAAPAVTAYFVSSKRVRAMAVLALMVLTVYGLFGAWATPLMLE